MFYGSFSLEAEGAKRRDARDHAGGQRRGLRGEAKNEGRRDLQRPWAAGPGW